MNNAAEITYLLDDAMLLFSKHDSYNNTDILDYWLCFSSNLLTENQPKYVSNIGQISQSRELLWICYGSNGMLILEGLGNVLDRL